MKKAIIVSVCALVAGTGWSSNWEALLRDPLYSAAFSEYANGEALSDKGVTGGSWGELTVLGVEAHAKVVGDRTYMNCSTAEDEGLVFTPAGEGFGGQKTVLMYTRIAGFEKLPTPRDGDKAAFIIYAPENGEAQFMGWTATGWVPLHLSSGLVTAVANEWYDLSIRLATWSDGTLRVQYRLKAGDAYEPLLTDDSEIWLRAAAADGDMVVREIEFRGEGDIEYLHGSEPRNGLVIGVKQR